MELQALSALAEESKKKKGRMDSVGREKAAQLIAHIWSDENLDPADSFESLTELQSEAVAEGIAKAWSRMGESRRSLFLSWLPEPTGDRASRRVGLIAAAVMDADGRTATDLLCKLLPEGRKKISKEMRQMLRSVLFGERRVKFENLSQPGISPASVMSVCSTLADIAFDPASDVKPLAKSRFALAIRSSSGVLGDHDIQRANELQIKVTDEVKRWPTTLRDQFQRELELVEPKPKVQTLPKESIAIPASEPLPAEPVEMPVAQGKINIIRQLSGMQEQLDNRIAEISRDVELLRRFANMLADFKNQYEHLQAELESTKERAAQSTERARQTLEMNRTLESQLEGQAAKASELSQALLQARSEGEAERKHLSQQISANAAGRIDEFKNRLGLLLARLVVDLPQKDVPVSEELGKVLLLQFHQFLEALRHEGIETRPRSAARS